MVYSETRFDFSAPCVLSIPHRKDVASQQGDPRAASMEDGPRRPCRFTCYYWTFSEPSAFPSRLSSGITNRCSLAPGELRHY
ncbi:hypothetical protein J6590_026506 [Homalodisca vitripennis]|nr:hypothetical protein J6590_026506 [Homalodisca vitripennis]